MQRSISVQNQALNDTHAQNAFLVSSNSELRRMFLSFMPIRYREYVQKLRAESNILYRQQRITPKVIQTKDRGADIQLVDAPMSDPTVQYALRDAEYAALGAARSHMERGILCASASSATPSQEFYPRAPHQGINLLHRSWTRQQRTGLLLRLQTNVRKHE
jgi:hypothetical protein